MSRPTAPNKAYQGAPMGMITINATRVSELNEAKSLPTANPNKLPSSDPDKAARNAEMQNTSTLDTFTVAPNVSRASGLSDMATSTRPSRERMMATTATAASTANNKIT